MEIWFGRGIAGDLDAAAGREWLVTNGLGGYASGTVAGMRTRRYHGVLVAAFDGPAARTMLVPAIEEIATYRGAGVALAVDRWADGTLAPAGHRCIESFHLDGTAPVWRFAIADAIVEKRCWMPHGRNAACVRYRIERAAEPVELALDAFAVARDHHGLMHAGADLDVRGEPGGFSFAAGGGRRCVVRCERAAWAVQPVWYHALALERERERGLDWLEDQLRAARASVTLAEGESCTIVVHAGDDASGDDASGDDGHTSWASFARRESAIASPEGARRRPPRRIDPPWIERLALAADQFVVARGDGHTVIAGYHWFTDWGRDTMISLPGLALVTGRRDVARSILRTFARAVDRGMIPNRFPDSGAAPEYNTVDATLWCFEALRAYLADGADDALATELHPVLAAIVDHHVRGTRYGIGVDGADGLLAAGEPGVQLTWMDAKVGDVVVTPRIGKPIEVNALWLNALGTMAAVADIAGEPREAYDRLAAAARAGFARFWNPRVGYCYDVLDGPDGDDDSLRPNQLYAAALPDTALDHAQLRAIVDACARELVTSRGLRSLAPSDPRYRGAYGGDPSARDASYHQGTVWGYLLATFAIAHARVYGDAARARSFLEPMRDAMFEGALGTLGEIFDGDAPHRPRGAIAQAWTVAECLRAWRALDAMETPA